MDLKDKVMIVTGSSQGIGKETGKQLVSLGAKVVFVARNKEKLKKLESKDLLEAKNYVEGSYLLDLEDPQKIADQMLFWEQVGDYQLMNSYLKKIKQVTLEDVKRVITKYFKHHALVTIEGK